MSTVQTRPTRRQRAALSVRRGAYILPSALTIGSLYFGFSAVILCARHFASMPLAVRPGTTRAMHMLGVADSQLELAALLILVAAFLDLLDGRVARMTGTLTGFGAQLDSLVDLISFGVAPGMLAFTYALSVWDKGWLPAFLFLTCGAVRLARFNSQAQNNEKRYFVGLPIPAAALLICALVLALPPEPGGDPSPWLALFVGALVVVLSFLMVSTVRYRSFKDIDLRRVRSSRIVVLAATIVVLFTALDWRWMLLLALATYAASGPLAGLIPLDVDTVVSDQLERVLEPDTEEIETDDALNDPLDPPND